MSAELELQKAIVTTLRGDVTLMATLTGVHDVKRQDADGGDEAEYPFVTCGEMFTTEKDTVGNIGFETLVRVHTWSATGSMFECKSIQGMIHGLLHDADLSVTGFHCYSVLRERSETDREDGTGIFHGVCEYRALVHTA